MALLCSLQRARPGIAHGKMLAGDLKAFDRILKVIESQDRYRGFGHPGGAAMVADADAERAPDRALWKLVTV